MLKKTILTSAVLGFMAIGSVYATTSTPSATGYTLLVNNSSNCTVGVNAPGISYATINPRSQQKFNIASSGDFTINTPVDATCATADKVSVAFNQSNNTITSNSGTHVFVRAQASDSTRTIDASCLSGNTGSGNSASLSNGVGVTAFVGLSTQSCPPPASATKH